MAIINWKNLSETNVEETLVKTESANRLILEDRANKALVINKTFLSIVSPTNAQISAQVKALTRQNNAIIRLLLRKLEAVD